MADNSWFEGDNSPGAGDLGQMRTLHSHLEDTADAAKSARDGLVALQGHVSTVWSGPAADAFKKEIDDNFKEQLAKLDESYRDAAEGFAAYIGAVTEIKTATETLAQQIFTAQGEYDTAASALQWWASSHPANAGQASGSISSPPLGHGSAFRVDFRNSPALPSDAKPADVSAAASADAAAQSSHQTAQSAVETAWGTLQRLYGKMHELQTNDRAAADKSVIASISKAHDAGIKNDSGWHHFWHAVATVAMVIGFILAVVAIVALIILMPEFSIAAFLGALESLSAVGTAVAAGGWLGAASAAVVYGGTAASVLGLAGDVGMKFSDGEEKPSWGRIGMDVFESIPAVGPVGRFVSRFGRPGRAVVSAVDGAIVSGKLHGAYSLEHLIDLGLDSKLANRLPGTALRLAYQAEHLDDFLLELGTNAKITWGAEAALWSNSRVDKLKEMRDLVLGEPEEPAGFEVPNPAKMQAIAQLRVSNPSLAHDAHDIAENLAAGKTTIIPVCRPSSEPVPAR